MQRIRGRLSPTQRTVCDVVVVGNTASFKIRGYFQDRPGYIEIRLGRYHGPGTYRLVPSGSSAVEIGVRPGKHTPEALSGERWMSIDGAVALRSAPTQDSVLRGRADGTLTADLSPADALNTLGGRVALEGS
jgi:hypothetical protein